MTRRLQVDRYGGVVKPPEPGSSGTTRAYPASVTFSARAIDHPPDPGSSR
jgi:hypothetical protein